MNAEQTLRHYLEALREQDKQLDIATAIGLIVPLAVEFAEGHRQGHRVYFYPSGLFLGDDGNYHPSAALSTLPSLERDVAILAPEVVEGGPGDATATVYSLAALFYELITLQSVGAGMRRPSELRRDIPRDLESILSKALVPDPAHRPSDLNALAQAFYQINTSASVMPPPAELGELDSEASIEVAISMSMMPPPVALHSPSAPQDAPLPPGVVPRQESALSEKEILIQLRRNIEADSSARYVVHHANMDHGPFTGVELLQQIAQHQFNETDEIKDNQRGTSYPLASSPEFAPFARHARLHRDQVAEKQAVEVSVAQESSRARKTTVVGLALFALLAAASAGWFLTSRGQRSDKILVVEEKALSIESDETLGVKKAKKAQRASTGVSRPQLAGGMRCAQAQKTYVEEMTIGAKRAKPDLTAGQFSGVLANGQYLNACGVPSSMGVNICAAIQNGRAVGVTVTTQPKSPSVQSCLTAKVRAMRFPSHSKLDITRTTFAASGN
ncbi:MAG: hypothetical protein MK135_17155 [Polyangiaceae bacterium]|nr:hypothetical protein [Polyangiaceae bacterium]